MSIYKLKSGKSPYFQYEFEVDGKRFRGSTKATSEREAKAVERQRRQEAEAKIKARAESSAADGATVAQVFADYWTDHGHKAKSAATNKTILRRAVIFLGPDRLYAEVGTIDAREFIRHLLQMPRMSGATVNRHLEIWRAVHNMAVTNERVVRPIAWKQIRQEQATQREVVMTIDDALAIYGHLPRESQEIVEFSLATGLRKAQVLELSWQRVNLDERTADVQRQKRKGGGRQIIQLNDTAVRILRQTGRAQTGFVFDATGFRKRWERAVRLSGVTGPGGVGDVRFHDLRHAFATWALRNGASLPGLMKQMGHSSIKVTMRYLTVMPEDARAAVDAVPSIQPLRVVEPHNIESTEKTQTGASLKKKSA